MAKKYIVMESSFNYNDETYDSTDGGTPIKIHDTKAAAEEDAKKRNRNSGTTHGLLYEYDYDYLDLIEDEGLSIQEAIDKRGPKEIFYVVEIDAD